MTAPEEDPYAWPLGAERSFIDAFQADPEVQAAQADLKDAWVEFKADVQPYVDQVKQAIAELVDLMRPETDPPICRQDVPPEGTE